MKLKCGCEIDRWPVTLCREGALIAATLIFMVGLLAGVAMGHL